MAENDQTRANLAARLRAAREQAGLSQGQVAKLLGLQRPAISEIEAGRRRVQSDELTNFARIYDVSVTWLLSQDDEGVDPAVELAARELVKLQKGDLQIVLDLLKTLRKSEDSR